MAAFLTNHFNEILRLLIEHVVLSLTALCIACLIAIPAGILLTRWPNLAEKVINFVSILQTIPTLALLALMIPFFGVGKLPAIIALCLYALMPILRNTYLGMQSVDANTLDAAKGMGMTRQQVIWKVQVPLAIPVIMAGVRLSAVYVIAWTTLAAYIGGGGLGEMIFNGLNLFRPDLILGGTIPVTCLALLVDFLMARLETWSQPKLHSQEGSYE
ncbi:ABC transporter permease [Hutsoniella sourekii]